MRMNILDGVLKLNFESEWEFIRHIIPKVTEKLQSMEVWHEFIQHSVFSTLMLVSCVTIFVGI